MVMKMNFGQRLRKLRENKKITQKELSKILNVSESAIGMYERGEREPNFETVDKIANFFNVPTDYLLGRTDDPASSESPSKPQEEPIVQFIMRSKKEMTPEAFARWEFLIREAKKAFVEDVEREERERRKKK